MTVTEEYAEIIKKLNDVEDWQDPWLRPYPLLSFVMADAITAITELTIRCQAAEKRCEIVDEFELLIRQMAEEDSAELPLDHDYKGPRVKKPTKLPGPPPRK